MANDNPPLDALDPVDQIDRGIAPADAPATDSVQATLDGWRADGAARRDPVRFATLDALARRAAPHTGPARDVLDARLQTLMEAFAKGPMPAGSIKLFRSTPVVSEVAAVDSTEGDAASAVTDAPAEADAAKAEAEEIAGTDTAQPAKGKVRAKGKVKGDAAVEPHTDVEEVPNTDAVIAAEAEPQLSAVVEGSAGNLVDADAASTALTASTIAAVPDTQAPEDNSDSTQETQSKTLTQRADASFTALLDAFAPSDVLAPARPPAPAPTAKGTPPLQTAARPAAAPLTGNATPSPAPQPATAPATAPAVSAARTPLPPVPAIPALADEPEIVEYFRQTWSRVSTDRQLRESLAQVPGNAGPLNSHHLIHRSLSLMLEMSPEYLRQFLSYAEALSWLEEMNDAGRLAGKPTARTTTPVAAPRSPRGKAR